MRIFSSAPYCLRVARRMSFTTCSAEAFCVPAFCLIFAPLKGYDEPEILPSQLSRFCLIGADAGHLDRKWSKVSYDAVRGPLWARAVPERSCECCCSRVHSKTEVRGVPKRN